MADIMLSRSRARSAGGRCAVDDVRDRAAYHLRWMRTGMYRALHAVWRDRGYGTHACISSRLQTYTDLRQLRVANVVQAILSD